MDSEHRAGSEETTRRGKGRVAPGTRFWLAVKALGVNERTKLADEARALREGFAEQAREEIGAAVALAGRCGIPPQNLVCADDEGRIAWALAGRIPRRVGWDGRLPVSWADGSHRWDGYHDPAEQPRLVDQYA